MASWFSQVKEYYDSSVSALFNSNENNNNNTIGRANEFSYNNELGCWTRNGVIVQDEKKPVLEAPPVLSGPLPTYSSQPHQRPLYVDEFQRHNARQQHHQPPNAMQFQHYTHNPSAQGYQG
jgi:hypothetical protein